MSDTATSNVATVYITVNSFPVAEDDHYAAAENQELDVAAADGVLANDFNADGNPLTAVLNTPPANGAVTLNNDGSFSYMPDSGFTGTDSFTYYAVNGPAVDDLLCGESYESLATVTITVSAVSGQGLGLLGTYYMNTDFDPFGFDEIDTQIAFNWEDMSPGYPLGSEYYSIQWTGEILAPVSGYYTFNMISDDGAILWVDGQQIFYDWWDQSASWDFGTPLYLQGGQLYPIILNYYNGPTDSAAYLYWSFPGQDQELVPQAYLYGDPACMLDNTNCYSSLPVGSTVANLLLSPGEQDVTLSSALVPGNGSNDNADFAIVGTQLA